MAQIVKEISVDVAKRNLFQAIVAKQHDSNSRFLKVTLTNEGTTISVDTNSVVTINASRADGLASAFAGVVNADGTVTVPLTTWMLELDDLVKCDITVVDSESRKLTSTSFELEVETAAYGDSEIMEDENYDLLVSLLGNVADVTGECQRATQAADLATANAEDATFTALAAAENANGVAAHLPTISDNGYWMLWDVKKGVYVETTHYAGGNFDPIDATLTKKGYAADAKATGDAISKLSSQMQIPGQVGQIIRVSAVDADGKVTAVEAVDMPGEENQIQDAVEPAEDDIPKVFFTGTAPTTKAEDELPLTMEYISKTKRFFSYVTLKVQGDSSAGYPKKNFNLKMFSDEARAEKLKMQFRNWKAKTHKYCLKANWIDHTHARNVVGGRLWDQIAKSRADYDSYPAEYRESSNSGAVDGFPVKVYLNGVYQGLYTWNIRKDESMFNMDDGTGTHAALIADEGNSVTVWRSLPSIDGSDWTDELNDTVPDAVKTGFRAAYTFVMNSTDEEFKANIGQYFYLSSLIDYYIYIYCILMIGGLAKSQTMFTYDAEKYLANIYDMDTTWALHWTGASFYDVETPCPSGYTAETEVKASNLLYERLVALFPEEIKARYAELRNSVLSDANIINEFERFMDAIPNDLYAEDFASTTAGGAFTEIPSKTTNNLQKLREIIVQRMAYCDEEIPKIGSGDSEEPGGGDEPGEDNTTYALENGTFTFTQPSSGTLTVENGNHVSASSNFVGNNYFNVSHVTRNISNLNDNAGINNLETVWLTIPAGSEVTLKATNIVVEPNTAVPVIGLRRTNGTNSVVALDLTGGEAAKTETIASEEKVACLLMYVNCGSSFSTEFDIELLVNGEKWI